jgi:low affinity Fe/Cu permease
VTAGGRDLFARPAVHLKLDELIYVISKARNRLIDAEELTDAELERLEEEFRKLRSAPLGNRTRGHGTSPVRARE